VVDVFDVPSVPEWEFGLGWQNLLGVHKSRLTYGFEIVNPFFAKNVKEFCARFYKPPRFQNGQEMGYVIFPCQDGLVARSVQAHQRA